MGDVDAIADLELVAFPLDPWSETLIEEGVAGRVPTTSYFVAEQDARFVGLCGGQRRAGRRGAAADRHGAGRASYRRRGRAPRRRRPSTPRAGGAERLLLEVRDDNVAARAFYAGAGFAEIAQRARYYRDGTDAVVLERFVRMAP